MTTQQDGVRAWVNGRDVAPDTPALSALDHGLTVGDGVFETLKIAAGQPFAPTRHARRIDRSAAGLGLGPIDHDAIAEGVASVLGQGPRIGFGRLRYTVTGGRGPLGSDRFDSPLTYIVTAGPQARPPSSGKVTVVPWTRNERAATAGLKTTSYGDNVVALARARQVGAIEAVFANTRGELCEATGANVFVVLDGELITPPTDSGLLAGITRELVIEWCGAAGLQVREQAVPIQVLAEADEVFLTSSTKDVLPVHAVDDRALEPGPLTAKVAAIFASCAAGTLDP